MDLAAFLIVVTCLNDLCLCLKCSYEQAGRSEGIFFFCSVDFSPSIFCAHPQPERISLHCSLQLFLQHVFLAIHTPPNTGAAECRKWERGINKHLIKSSLLKAGHGQVLSQPSNLFYCSQNRSHVNENSQMCVCVMGRVEKEKHL